MSSWLILFVGVIYIGVAIQLFYQHKIGLGLSFLFYAFSNLGLYLAARGI